MLEERWRITLCGSLVVRQGVQVITRFRTQKTGLLLAYLALHGERRHGREELAELFWPESDRPLQSLRMALVSLRRQLEPPGVGQGQVLSAGRSHVGLVSGTVRTDVADFHTALAESAGISESGEKTRLLRQGVEAVSGELLPGSYEDWVLQTRALLAEQVQGALNELVGLLAAQQEWEQVLKFALRWAHMNTLNEEAHLAVMQILLALRRPNDALKQFQRLRALLWEEMGVVPSAELCTLAAAANTRLETVTDVGEEVQEGKRSPAEVVEFSGDAKPASMFAHAPPTIEAARSIVRLPLPLTPFFGRKEELHRLGALLMPRPEDEAALGNWAPAPWKPRVVTLRGTGGSGKTRLAIEAARTCAAEAVGMVCFVGLVDADTRERMVQLIAEAVCPNAAIDRVPMEIVTTTLEDAGFSLLILDNMEQILEAGAEVVSELLQLLPGLTVLVASRVRLNLEGEREFVVGALPTPEQVDTPECLLEFASVELFVDRAKAACADFQLTVRNAANVAALCRRLEGLPLALELAASWAQTLTPAQMLVRLDRRFELLRARRKGMASRHQTLEVCIDWSFRHLPPEVREFFCRLCLLRGDWSLATAEQIAGDSQALEKLQRLREASFLLAREVVETAGATLRFHMLESLREFGLNQLAPGEIDAGYERLTQYLLAIPNVEVMRVIHTENVRTAALWCRTSASPLELALLNKLKMFWLYNGGWREQCAWMQDALRRHAGEETDEYRKAWNTLGALHWLLKETAKAKHCFEEALTLAEQTGDDTLAVRLLNNLAMTANSEGDLVRGCALGEQCLSLARKLGDEPLVTALTNNVGSTYMNLKQYEKAQEYLEESLHRSREQGITGIEGLSLANLAEVASGRGDGQTARQRYQESLEVFRQAEELPRVVQMLGRLSDVMEAQGELSQARRLRDERASLMLRLEGEY